MHIFFRIMPLFRLRFLYAQRVVLCYTPGRPSVRPLAISCVRNSSYSFHRNYLKLATMNLLDV